VTYVKDPMFWLAVVIVAVIVNYAWNFFTKRGKLV
jgi:hypothetical protein